MYVCVCGVVLRGFVRECLVYLGNGEQRVVTQSTCASAHLTHILHGRVITRLLPRIPSQRSPDIAGHHSVHSHPDVLRLRVLGRTLPARAGCLSQPERA